MSIIPGFFRQLAGCRRFAARALGLCALPLAACAPAGEPANASLAEAPRSASDVRPFDRADADPALWKIADEDTTIHLFGTMHALRPDLVWFDDAIAEALAASDELVIEMVPPEPAAMQAIIARRGLYADGGTLRSRLTDRQFAMVEQSAKAGGLPIPLVDRMRPWFAAVTLSIAPMKALGYEPGNGAEAVLMAAAREAGKPVLGIESFDQQIGYFADLAEADQIAFLTATLDEQAEMEALFARMERAWATGDVADTARLINESLTATPEITSVLLTDRNARWAEWIEQRMERPGTVFVAVGTGHLAGDGSLRHFLARRSIEAERVSY